MSAPPQQSPLVEHSQEVVVARLRLPGPRPLWWLLCVGLVALSLTLALSARETPAQREASIRFTIRLSAMTWRLAHWAGVDAQADKPQSPRTATRDGGKGRDKAGPAAGLADARRLEIDELFRLAQLSDAGKEQPSLSQEVVAHCIATEQDKQALELARKTPVLSADLRTALVALPAEHTAAVAVLLPDAASPEQASRDANQGSFGRGWSDWTRDRIRMRLAARPGALPGGARVAEMVASDRDVTATAMTLMYLAVLLGLWGVAAWLTALLRGAIARSRGQPRWEWLRRRYPGLPNDNPYTLDAITPWFGLAAWIGVQLAVSPLFAMPGLRAGSPFGVLMEAMVGLAAAQWAVTWLSPTRVPLLHAARLGGDPAIPFGRASTAALRALAALLPVMAITTIVSSLLIVQTDTVHPVATMLLARADPVTLSVVGAAAVVVGPLGEELLFRGLIYRQIRQRWGIGPALWFSSLLFAAMHASPTQLPAYLVLGAAFALTYEWVGSLWASVILHGLWNLGTFVVLACAALS